MNVTEPPAAIDQQTRIGHVHLKVADLERSLAFDCGVLGFEVQERWRMQAAYISAGGYQEDPSQGNLLSEVKAWQGESPARADMIPDIQTSLHADFRSKARLCNVHACFSNPSGNQALLDMSQPLSVEFVRQFGHQLGCFRSNSSGGSDSPRDWRST